jgi:hypothetical protein
MMTMTLEVPQPIKSHEPLEKVFNFLMTPTMYAQMEYFSAGLSMSKGALIRLALEDYLIKLEVEDTVDYFRKMDDENSIEPQDLGDKSPSG